MREIFEKRISKCMNFDQKRAKVEALPSNCTRFEKDFLRWIWIYFYDPRAKQQTRKWKHSGLQRPKKFHVHKFAGKVLSLVFWDFQGEVIIGFMDKGRTGTRNYYSTLTQRKNCREKCFIFAEQYLCTQIACFHSNSFWLRVLITWTPPLFTSVRLLGLSRTEVVDFLWTKRG